MRNATPKNTSVDDVLRFLRVYHNSPHLLKKADGTFVDPETGERLGFDHRFIGSGEGFQAHGWGSYFSVNDLAHYASTNDGDTYDGIKITRNDKYVISKGGDTNTSLILFQAIRMGYRTNTAPQAEDTIAKFVEEKLSELSESQERRLAKQKRLLDALKGNEPWAMTAINSRWGEVITDPKTGYEYDTTYSLEEFEQETYERIKEEAKKYRDALEFIERNPDYVKNFTSKAVRHKYQVEIPNPQTHRYLEEGALLTKEEESRIREAAPDTKRIKYHRLNEERLEGRKVWEVYDLLAKVLNGADKASALLNKAGFVGIHYNGRQDGECYVIFNENDAEITDHYRFRRQKAHLAGVHTLTTENLRHALKMGGLANPSIAVYDTERGLPTRTFGEVALIVPRDLVDAKTGRHKGTYNRDAWTPTYPQVSYELTKSGEDALMSLSDKVRNLGDVASARLLMNEANQSDLSPSTLETRLRTNEGVRKLYESERRGEDFDRYVSSLAKSIEMEDFLFAGQRADGSWKKVPHTLDNVSKLMKRERAEGSKAYPFAYALSKLGSRYRSLSAIRKGEDLLSGKDQAKWEATRKEFANLANELQGEAKSLFDIRGEEHLAALLADGENLFGRPLTVTEEARVSALKEQMKALPTDYFETKVDRPVGLSEFVEAVVPEGTSPELVAELEKSGIKVSTYDSTKEGAMNEAVLSAMDRADATDRGVRFRTSEQNIEEVNRKVNEELEKFVAGELSPKHIFNLGYPSPILISAGIIDAPIQITLRILKRKSTSAKHVFDPLSLQGLPKALQHPIAITEYKEDGNHVNVIVELSHNGENLLVGIKAAVRNRSQVNDIKGLFYKSTTGWLRWIKEGKALYVNNEKVQEIIETRRTNPASQSQSFLNSATNITNNPEDTKTEGQGSTDPKHRFRRAERAGDVSGAAETVSDFMRNASPKNTTVDDVLRFLRVYHNSPHLLKKADGAFVDPETGERLGFDHRFMGSGEGFQAHGWGSYFSVNDLEGYASPNDVEVYDGIRLTQNDAYVTSRGGSTNIASILFQTIRTCWTRNGSIASEKAVKKSVGETLRRIYQKYEQIAREEEKLLEALKDNEPWAVTLISSVRGSSAIDPKTGYEYATRTFSVEEEKRTYEYAKRQADRYKAALLFTKSNPDYVRHFETKVTRHKYTVEIPDPDTNHYIKEDRRVTKREAEMIHDALNDNPEAKGSPLADELWRGRKWVEAYELLSRRLGGEKQASALLNKAGFVGIHYNGQIDGECYVIFNENDAKITDHYRFRRTSEAERLEIERKAKADGSWLLAPDGTPTTLSEDGWIASRSSDFRAEYGDWEKSRNAKWLSSGEYVSEMGYFEFPHVGKTLIEDIAAYYLEKEEGHVERPGIGDILLDEKSVKNSYYHGVGANKITAFAIVPDVLKQGVQIDEQENWKGRGYDTVMIAAPVSIEGEGYVCSIIVKQTTKNRLYVHELYLQKNLQESASSPGGKGQDAITSRVDSSLHPDLIANVLKEYVSHKDDLPESFYQPNGEPKREIVEEYLRAEEEKEIRYRRVKADPMNAISPINPQWDGEWYSSEDLTGKSTADLLELPAAPATPEKRPTQSVAEYAETMSRHYADPRVRFRTGSHTENLRAPQPPRITDGMSLYEVAQLQHEYNRNYRDYLSSSMKRMDALVTTKGRFIRYMVDSARPVELFCKEMERMGIGMTAEVVCHFAIFAKTSFEPTLL